MSIAIRGVGDQQTVVTLSDKQKQWIRKKVTKQYQDDIQLEQLALEQLKTKLKLVDKTRVLQQGAVSLKPVGLTRNLLILLVIFVAVCIAFMSMLLALFRDKVKQRLAEEH